MRQSILQRVLRDSVPAAVQVAATVAAIVAFTGGAAYAQQGGGNGQGGSGGGNAHSAATAGMTYHGDPAPSPLDMAANKTKQMDSGNGTMRPVSPSDSMSPSGTTQ